MVPVNQENLARSEALSSQESDRKEEVVDERSDSSEPKGDPEMAPVFLRHLLPVFAQVFQSAMLQSVR